MKESLTSHLSDLVNVLNDAYETAVAEDDHWLIQHIYSEFEEIDRILTRYERKLNITPPQQGTPI